MIQIKHMTKIHNELRYRTHVEVCIIYQIQITVLDSYQYCSIKPKLLKSTLRKQTLLL